ncbi:MAG: LptE family protein, partial [Bacteroidales bacterium]|nr:LptE family protein [Bacteroidales bacterium]
VINRKQIVRKVVKNASRVLFCLILMCMPIINGCVGGYSFTGASIPADAKTISVANFPNYATTVYPQLSQLLSDGLRNMFSSQTNLVVTESGGDLDLSGEITTYTVQPTAITSNDQAAMNRLTIGVKVNFTNSKDPNTNFEQTFTRYKEFSANLNFSSVEGTLVNQILEEIIEDIFNKAVVNW